MSAQAELTMEEQSQEKRLYAYIARRLHLHYILPLLAKDTLVAKSWRMKGCFVSMGVIALLLNILVAAFHM